MKQYGRISLGDGGTLVKGFQQPKNLCYHQFGQIE
jgi:hypothetical protein